MADEQQPAPQPREGLADRVKAIRRTLEGRLIGQTLSPGEQALKAAVDAILGVLDDIGTNGIDPGEF